MSPNLIQLFTASLMPHISTGVRKSNDLGLY
jgi:hypothetical protein